jgi:hypothetical protein
MHFKAKKTGLVALEANIGPMFSQIGPILTTFLDFS